MVFRLKWRIAVGGVALLIAAIAFAVVAHYRGQRSYEGKPILTWAVQLLGPHDVASATRVFQEIGPEAVPVLAKALTVQESSVDSAVRSIAPHLPDTTRVRLFQLFDPQEPDRIRLGAVSALEVMGRRAEGAVPELGIALRSTNRMTSMRAAGALGKIGPPALPQLTSGLKDFVPHVRQMSIYGLARMGHEAIGAIPALIDYLRDPLAPARPEAAAVITQMGRPAVPVLLDLLAQEPPATQRIVIRLLGDIGPLAREGKPALMEIAGSHSDETVRRAAADALEKISNGR